MGNVIVAILSSKFMLLFRISNEKSILERCKQLKSARETGLYM